MKKFALIVLLSLSLQGCIFVAGAAAGAAAVAVVYDHRKFEQIKQDRDINNGVLEKVSHIPNMSQDGHVNVTVFNNVVLLTGEVTTSSLREQAEAAAHEVPGVSKIYNQITIKGPTSSLTRASDSWITAKIKTQMMAVKDLKPSMIKVVTENGTVYLMGIVSHEQADTAVDIARQVSGVQKVVKIFQYKDGQQEQSEN
jgi:osmotically-inducible protein OsmY